MALSSNDPPMPRKRSSSPLAPVNKEAWPKALTAKERNQVMNQSSIFDTSGPSPASVYDVRRQREVLWDLNSKRKEFVPNLNLPTAHQIKIAQSSGHNLICGEKIAEKDRESKEKLDVPVDQLAPTQGMKEDRRFWEGTGAFMATGKHDRMSFAGVTTVPPPKMHQLAPGELRTKNYESHVFGDPAYSSASEDVASRSAYSKAISATSRGQVAQMEDLIPANANFLAHARPKERPVPPDQQRKRVSQREEAIGTYGMHFSDGRAEIATRNLTNCKYDGFTSARERKLHNMYTNEHNVFGPQDGKGKGGEPYELVPDKRRMSGVNETLACGYLDHMSQRALINRDQRLGANKASLDPTEVAPGIGATSAASHGRKMRDLGGNGYVSQLPEKEYVQETKARQLERATDAKSKARNTSEIRPGIGIRHAFRLLASNASGRFLLLVKLTAERTKKAELQGHTAVRDAQGNTFVAPDVETRGAMKSPVEGVGVAETGADRKRLELQGSYAYN
eukprot:g15284.t1